MWRILSLLLYGYKREHIRLPTRLLGERILLVSFETPEAVQIDNIGYVINISRGGLAFRYLSKENLTSGLHKLKLFSFEDPDACIENIACKVIYDYEAKFILSLPPSRRCGVEFESITDEQLPKVENLIVKCAY